MSHRKKKKRSHGGVELNLAAMLDMAFQLLTFFILTFKPAPIEGEIVLNLPQAAPVEGQSGKSSDPGATPDVPPAPKDSLVISVFSDKVGGITMMAIGDQNIEKLGQLESRLRNIVGDKNSTFEQVLIQVDSTLRYEELMKVVEICSKLKRSDGSRLTGLSFVERPNEAAP